MVKSFCCTYFIILFTNMIFAQSKIIDDTVINSNIMDNSDSLFIAYFYEPVPQKVGASIIQLGGSFTLLQTPDVEEIPIPAIEIQFKHGIMKNFSLVSALSTNYFSSLLHVGLQWNTNSSSLSLGLANQLGGFIGTYHLTMFKDVFAYAFTYLPIIRLGIRADEFSTTLSFGASYVFSGGNRVGNFKTPGQREVWNDLFCTLAVEQPLFKKKIISIGLSFNYSKSPYQSWFFFDAIDQYRLVPQFFFGVQL